MIPFGPIENMSVLVEPAVKTVAGSRRRVTGFEVLPTLTVDAMVCGPPPNPRASTVPPLAGRLAMAELIQASAVVPLHPAEFAASTQRMFSVFLHLNSNAVFRFGITVHVSRALHW